MDDIKNTHLNTDEPAQNEEQAPAKVTDDTIQYTFVVPKGEVFRETGAWSSEKESGEEAPEYDSGEINGTECPEEEQALPEHAGSETIQYTFVVPKGEKYVDPDMVTAAEKPETAEGGSAEGSDAEERDTPAKKDTTGKVTRYGLPLDHPEMGELAKKQEARRRYRKRRSSSFRTRFYVIMTAIIVLVGAFIFSLSGVFTVDSIEVQGNSHYTAEEIINMGHASPGRNILYDSNKAEIREYLEQNPYIKSAVVSMRLPSTLVIQVTERTERLAFRYDDDYLIMDEDGILLKKTRNTPKTTVVEGIVVSKIKLGEKIGTDSGKNFDRALSIIHTMIDSDLYFVKLDVTKEKSTKAYVYDTLVVKTDHDTLIENMKNGRLHLVLEKLFSDGIERGTITFDEDGSASFQPAI